MLRTRQTLPYPRPIDTCRGRLAIGIITLVTMLALLVPWMRGPLEASAQLIVAALAAGFAGAGWRVVADMLATSRWVRPDREMWAIIATTSALSLMVLALAWQGWQAPIPSQGTEALFTVATRAAAGLLALMAVQAGYADGDDVTWRAEHGLTR